MFPQQYRNHVISPIKQGGVVLTASISILVSLFLYSIYDVSFLTTDSAQYISVAKNILLGNGFSTDLVYYEQHYQIGGLPVPQTVFPPGYSLLIAMPIALGINPVAASFLVNSVSFFLIPLLMYRILSVSGFTQGLSLIPPLLWMSMYINWFFVLISVSEVSFVLFVLGSVLCYLEYENRNHDVRFLLLSAAFIGFSFLIRYAGLFFMLAMLLYQLGAMLQTRSLRRMPDFLLYAFLTFLFVVLVFGRNYYYVGYLTGGVKIANPSSLFELIQSFYWAILKLVGVAGTSYWDVIGRYLLLIILLPLLYAIFVVIRRERDFAHGKARIILLSVLMIIVYLSFLVYLAASNDRQYLNERYLMPLLPFVLMLITVLSAFVVRELRNKKMIPVFVYSMILFVLLISQTGRFLQELDWITGRQEYETLTEAMSTPNGNTTYLNYMKENISKEHPLLMPNGQLAGIYLDVPVVGLTQSLFTNRIWTDSEVKKLAKQYQIEHILFLKTPYLRENPANRNKIFFNKLHNGPVPEWIEILYDSDKFSIYKVI